MFYGGPFGGEDGVAGGVAGDEVGGHAVGAEDAFELASDAFDGGAGTLVANVGVKADAEDVPLFEGVGEHEQLGLGVGGSADGGFGEPGVSDFAGIGSGAVVESVAAGPGPALEIEEARGADDGSVVESDSGEGDGGSGFLPGESRVNVLRGFEFALGDRAPLIERRVGGGGLDESVGVAVGEGFEADVASLERGRFGGHGINMR